MKRILLFVIILSLLISMYGCTAEKTEWNLVEQVRKTLAKDYGNGEGVKIAVIDSGTSEKLANDQFTLNFSEEDYAIDRIDHGVPIINIISNEEFGLAPKASVYSLKAINKYGNASTQSIYEALEWCLNNSIDIINMSLSFGIYSENIECVIGELIDKGVIIVASISNESKTIDYPSMYDGVICVGKTNVPHLYEKNRSVIFESDYSVQSIGIEEKRKDYVGNSYLTPIVTGIIACLINKINTGGHANEELIFAVNSILSKSNVRIS